MNGWSMSAFTVGKTVTRQPLRADSPLANYAGEVATFFEDYASVMDLTQQSAYFAAPEAFLRKQIWSYGGQLAYTVAYSGYDFQGYNSSCCFLSFPHFIALISRLLDVLGTRHRHKSAAGRGPVKHDETNQECLRM